MERKEKQETKILTFFLEIGLKKNSKDNIGLQMKYGCCVKVEITACYHQTPCKMASIVAQLSDYANIITGKVNLNEHKTTSLNSSAKEYEPEI